MSIQTKTMKVKSDTALAETTTIIRDTVTFDVSKMPNGITYKGLKAVLSFADPIQWNKASTYDALTVVWDDASHGSYASKRPVPSNIELTNEFYWLRTADLDAQVEMYRQEVREMDGRVTANAQAISAETKRAEGAEQLLNETIAKKTDAYTTIEEHGGVGDGVTDDSDALIEAIASNKCVLLGNKTYYIGKNINIVSGMHIIGNGEKTIVKMDGSFKCLVTDFSVTRPIIENCTFMGNLTTRNTFLHAVTMLYCRIYNCWFQNFGSIFKFKTVYDCIFTDLDIYNCGDGDNPVVHIVDPDTDDSSNNLYFTNIRIEGGKGAGLQIDSGKSNQIWVRNWKDENSTTRKMTLRGTLHSFKNCEFFTFASISDYAMHISCSNSDFEDIFVGGDNLNAKAAFYLNYAKNVTLKASVYNNLGTYKDNVYDYYEADSKTKWEITTQSININGVQLDGDFIHSENITGTSITRNINGIVQIYLTGPIDFRWRVDRYFDHEVKVTLNSGESDYIIIPLPASSKFSYVKISGDGTININFLTHGFYNA